MRLAFLVCVACGQPAPAHIDAEAIDAPPCVQPGRGTVSGTVMGAQVVPVRAAWESLYAGAPTLLLAEAAGNLCSSVTGVGDFLNISVCTKAVGTYPLAGSFPTCPSPNGGAVFTVAASPASVKVKATSGMLVIDSLDSMCMNGTFTITFETNDTVTGSFAAVVCN